MRWITVADTNPQIHQTINSLWGLKRHSFTSDTLPFNMSLCGPFPGITPVQHFVSTCCRLLLNALHAVSKAVQERLALLRYSYRWRFEAQS